MDGESCVRGKSLRAPELVPFDGFTPFPSLSLIIFVSLPAVSRSSEVVELRYVESAEGLPTDETAVSTID